MKNSEKHDILCENPIFYASVCVPPYGQRLICEMKISVKSLGRIAIVWGAFSILFNTLYTYIEWCLLENPKTKTTPLPPSLEPTPPPSSTTVAAAPSPSSRRKSSGRPRKLGFFSVWWCGRHQEGVLVDPKWVWVFLREAVTEPKPS